MYEALVLNAKANPRRSRAKPMRAFFASSAANIGVSAKANIEPIDSKAAGKVKKWGISGQIIVLVPKKHW